MKKYIILAAVALMAFSGCKEETFTPIKGEKPEERMYKALAEYEQELINHEYGWKAYLYSDGGMGSGYYMEFSDDDRMKMLADLGEEMASELRESGYRLKAVMAPSLLFDTDNYIHMLANPDPSEAGGTAGSGFESDFEFEFREQSNDTLKLIGKKRRSELLLIKATEEEQNVYLNGGFKDRLNEMIEYLVGNPNLYIEPGGEEKLQFSINWGIREVSFVWVESGEVKSVKQPFAFSVNGIHLKDTLSYGDIHVQEVLWNDGFTAVTYNGDQMEVKTSLAPLVPLYMLMGTQYSTMYFPQTLIPGGSEGFNTMWNQYITDIGPGAPGQFTFNYGHLTIDFDTINERLTLGFFVSQNGGDSGWTTYYPYNYTLDSDGVFTLTLNKDGITGNRYDEEESSSFIEKFDGMRIKLDFHIDGANVFGKIIDADDPEFYMIGILD